MKVQEYLISGSAHFTPQLYLFMVLGFAIAGAAMVILAKPFETRSQTTSRGPHSARFYRIVGSIYILVALGLTAPALLGR